LGGSGTFSANQSSDATISISHDDTSSQGSVNNSGATVIQDVTLDGYGHVTALGSHTLTLANLGYTGATNANYITNNNQLTNGAGYTTNVGDITGVNAGSGITGGGTSGTVTISHADTSTINGTYGQSLTDGNVVQDFLVTSDGFGHVTAISSNSINLDNRYTKPNTSVTFTTVTAGTFNTTSDRNTKTDITPISDAVSKVQQLGGYSFTFKDSGEKSSGVIAQEVQAVLPELVQEGGEGHLTVQYGNMVGLLIEAIKEQQAQIDTLTAKLNG
jgi:hypothetical protein